MLPAEKLAAQISLGQFGLNDEPRLTFATFAQGRLSGHVEHNLRLTTASKYRKVMRVHWLPRLGQLALADIALAQDVNVEGREIILEAVAKG
jgi:hypothetical protein